MASRLACAGRARGGPGRGRAVQSGRVCRVFWARATPVGPGSWAARHADHRAAPPPARARILVTFYLIFTVLEICFHYHTCEGRPTVYADRALGPSLVQPPYVHTHTPPTMRTRLHSNTQHASVAHQISLHARGRRDTILSARTPGADGAHMPLLSTPPTTVLRATCMSFKVGPQSGTSLLLWLATALSFHVAERERRRLSISSLSAWVAE